MVVRILEKFIRPSVSTGWLTLTGLATSFPVTFADAGFASFVAPIGLGGLAAAAGLAAFTGFAALVGFDELTGLAGLAAFALFTALAAFADFAAFAVFTLAIAHRP
jgi:hypothetical protein